MKTNTKTIRPPVVTAEGGKASSFKPFAELTRAVSSCFLWEKQFYESGVDIAARISGLVAKCVEGGQGQLVENLAIKLRTEGNLRHAPLYLCHALSQNKALKADTLFQVIQRVDELAEFTAMSLKDGGKLGGQAKKGLAKAFTKFSEYQFSKYKNGGDVKTRDVMFLVHPKAANVTQDSLFKKIANNQLPVANTWETRLSAGEDKKAVFTDLLQNNQLGYIALLRNLRNMAQAGVDMELIKQAIKAGALTGRALPFRYFAAWQSLKAIKETRLDGALQEAMLRVANVLPKLTGSTLVLIDVSGSMGDPLSAKSDMTRLVAASALALYVQSIAADCKIFTFSNDLVGPVAGGGFGLFSAIQGSQHNSGTNLGHSLNKLYPHLLPTDRLIVITDEQSADRVPAPVTEKSYMINVAGYQNGVAGGAWTKIDGFSEGVIRYIQEKEYLDANDNAV